MLRWEMDLSPGTRSVPDRDFGGSITIMSFILVYAVAVFLQYLHGLCPRFRVIELDMEHTLLEVPVVNDADVLDGDIVLGKDGGDLRERTRTVRDIQIDPVLLPDSGADVIREAVAVGLAFREVFQQLLPVSVPDREAEIRQLPDEAVQHDAEVILVGKTDLLPHLRRGGGDSRDVLEASGRDGAHVFLRSVQLADSVDQSGGDDVGKMTGRRRDIVVFGGLHDQGKSAEGGDEGGKLADLLQRHVVRWSQNVPCVLDHPVGCIFIAGLLRAGHRVAADEAAVHAELMHSLMNTLLCGADVRDDRPEAEVRLQRLQLAEHGDHRRAEKDVVAAGKCT